jgi:hypothetical protein
LSIQELTNHLNISTFKGDISINEIGAAFKDINLDGKYANINIQFNSKAAYTIDATGTYSAMSLPTELAEFTIQNGINSSVNHYVGNASNGNAAVVKVNLFQGNLNIR